MGPVLESEIVTGKERARVGVVLELELMFCLVALMTCEQAHSTQMDAHLHTGHSLPWTVTKVCARAQEQVEHEEVQDEMAERWVLRLGEDDGASQRRRHPEKGVTSVEGRRRLGCSEGLNKSERVEGVARRKWLNAWEGSGFRHWG